MNLTTRTESERWLAGWSDQGWTPEDFWKAFDKRAATNAEMLLWGRKPTREEMAEAQAHVEAHQRLWESDKRAGSHNEHLLHSTSIFASHLEQMDRDNQRLCIEGAAVPKGVRAAHAKARKPKGKTKK